MIEGGVNSTVINEIKGLAGFTNDWERGCKFYTRQIATEFTIRPYLHTPKRPKNNS
jgi:hypothetical protein